MNMQPVIYPPFLKENDQVVFVSPSGKVESEYVFRAKNIFAKWGLKPIVGQNALGECGRFAGTDAERLHDLIEALTNDSVKAIFCTRGGYGAVRLLNDLNPDLIAQHPKWLIGYSDITLLHAVFGRLGIVSLHAPMARHLSEDVDDESTDYLRSILFGDLPCYCEQPSQWNRTGKAEGKLVGGNLSVLSGLRGTRFDPIAPGSILFVEDIGERHYHIERLFYNLKLGGVLEQLSGLIVGQFTDCPEDPLMENSIYGMISEMVSGYDYPVCYDYPVGHGIRNFPLMHGAWVRFEVSSEATILDFSAILNR